MLVHVFCKVNPPKFVAILIEARLITVSPAAAWIVMLFVAALPPRPILDHAIHDTDANLNDEIPDLWT
jgi:hypothetical protein